VTGVAVLRLATGGWDAMLADHSRYVFSGMSLLDGRGYVGEAGETFYVRSPAYPVMVGGGFAVAGSDGAHLVAWGLGLVGLLLALWLAARAGGPLGALATAAAIIAVPQFWEQIVSLGIDLPHAAFYLGAIALLWHPRPGHWLAAGGLLGLALLIKETVAPAVVLLPIAWLPAWSGLSWRIWARLSLVFLLAIAVVAGWWWFLVWRETGLLFPLNSLRAIVPDEAELSLDPTRTSAVAWLAAAAAWAYLLFTRFRDSGVRLLAFGALALAPAVAATVLLSQPERNLTVVVLLSCVAAGVAVADVSRGAAVRVPSWARLAGTAAVALILIAGPVIGQQSVRAAHRDSLAADAAAVIRPTLRAGQEVVSSFRGRSPLGVELFGANVRVRLLPVAAVQRSADASDYLWLGERRGTLFGLTRADWQRVLGSDDAAYLVLLAPHPLTPTELLPALRSADGQPAGLTLVDTLARQFGTADIFQITPGLIDRATEVHLHAEPGALIHWLDEAEAAGMADAAGSLLEARPVVFAAAADLTSLAGRLGAGACFRPMQEDTQPVLSIEPAEGQGDCVGG
jgi:hypothetical protein